MIEKQAKTELENELKQIEQEIRNLVKRKIMIERILKSRNTNT